MRRRFARCGLALIVTAVALCFGPITHDKAVAKAGGQPGLPHYGVFVFSNLCFERESGDVGGNRITIARFRDGDRLEFEYGNGPLSSAIIENLKISGNLLRANGTSNDGKVSLDAKLFRDFAELKPAFEEEGSATTERLPRVRNFAAHLPICKATH